MVFSATLLKKCVFRYGLGECMYLMSGFFIFDLVRGITLTQTNRYTSKYKETPKASITWIESQMKTFTEKIMIITNSSEKSVLQAFLTSTVKSTNRSLR